MKWLDRFRQPSAASPIWRGMVRSFAEVDAKGDAFASAQWESMIEEELRSTLAGEIREELDLEHEALVMALRAIDRRPVHILDFGGGPGLSYAWLRKRMPSIDVRYTVVEVGVAIRVGKRVFGEAIEFVSAPVLADVVFAKSALQYVEDYRGALRALFAAAAQFVVLEKFSGVAGESYASAQVNVPGSVTPYWFISLDEVFAIANDAGFDRALWRRLPRWYPQDDVPEARRMGQASTLVFRRRD